MLRVVNFQLGILNWFCRIEPTERHPVFCDDVVDEWSAHRVSLGLSLVGCLASTGDTDGAFAALEDVVSMLEKIMRLISDTDGGCAEVRVRCEWLDRTKVSIKLHGDRSRSLLVNVWEFEQSEGGVGSAGVFEGHSGPSSADFVLTSDQYRYRHQLDPIRSDPRYTAYVERVKALI